MTGRVTAGLMRLWRFKNPLLYRLGLYRDPFRDQIRSLDEDVDLGNRSILFIGGLHRSGTSLLHKNIRAHPFVTGIDNDRVPASEGQFLQDVFPADRTFGGPGYFAFDRGAHFTEDSPLVTPENARRILRQWAAWMDLDAARLMLEKSPSNLLRSRFLQALFPGCHFLFVSRHPLAVSLATRKWARATLEHLLEHWARAYSILEADLPLLENARVVKYEDLVGTGRDLLTDICRSVGLGDYEPPEAFKDYNARYFAQLDQATLARLRRRVSRDAQATFERWGYSLSV